MNLSGAKLGKSSKSVKQRLVHSERGDQVSSRSSRGDTARHDRTQSEHSLSHTLRGEHRRRDGHSTASGRGSRRDNHEHSNQSQSRVLSRLGHHSVPGLVEHRLFWVVISTKKNYSSRLVKILFKLLFF